MELTGHKRRIASFATLLGVVCGGWLTLFGADGGAGAGPVFEITRFEIDYALANPELPPPEQLMQLDVPLGLNGGIYVPENFPGATATTLKIGSVPPGARFSAAGIVAIMERLVAELNRRDLQMVFIRPDNQQINLGESVDLRAAGDRSLRLVVWVGQVAEVRTIAKGERFSPDESINHPAHARIRAESPIQAAQRDEPAGLFRRRLVDHYATGLSLHPSRRVEVSLASAGEPGKVVLDYLVNEVRPWQVFAQSSNTGSKATGVWRTRLGFQHTQFTNHDDILNLDVVSSGSWDTKAGLASYSFPLLRPEKLRLRIFGSAGDFKVSDLGFAQTKFTGDNWQAGSEVTYRLRLRDRYGVAAQAGITYNRYQVGSSIGGAAGSGGRSGFLIPFLGARVTRQGERIGLSFAGRLEHSVKGVPNEDAITGIEQLGRSEAAPSWTVFKGGFSAVGYLETLFERLRPERTAASPAKLAHEISASLRGQYVVSRDRLVPQEQDLLGGAYSVRGYPDSILSADDSLVATAEYTFHVGRVYSIPPLFGADIGLLMRGFTDFGHSWITPASGARSNLRLTEQDRSMWSAGVGTEISIRKQISLRCDVGYVLRDIKDPFNNLAENGDIRAHVIGSITW